MPKILNPVSNRTVNADSSLGKVIRYFRTGDDNYRDKATKRKRNRKHPKRAVFLP
jgi:hypothetical protein